MAMVPTSKYALFATIAEYHKQFPEAEALPIRDVTPKMLRRGAQLLRDADHAYTADEFYTAVGETKPT